MKMAHSLEGRVPSLDDWRLQKQNKHHTRKMDFAKNFRLLAGADLKEDENENRTKIDL